MYLYENYLSLNFYKITYKRGYDIAHLMHLAIAYMNNRKGI